MDVNFTEDDLATLEKLIAIVEEHYRGVDAMELIGSAEWLWERVRQVVEGDV